MRPHLLWTGGASSQVLGWQSLLIFMVSAAVWLWFLMAISKDQDKCPSTIDTPAGPSIAQPTVPGNNPWSKLNQIVGSSEADRLFSSLCPRHDRRVAVVMPFIFRQVDDLVANLEEWTQHFPCLPTATLNSEETSVRLFFYFNNARDERVEATVLEAWKKVSEHPRIQEAEGVTPLRQEEINTVGECFSDVSFLWADLAETQPNHAKNTGVMFRLLFSFMRDLGIQYFFLMEPDCFPVRAGWLDRIRFESLCGSDFWVKGSAFRNARPPQYAWASHINGNAMYNAGDEEFIELVNNVARIQGGAFYDVGLYRTIMLNGSLEHRKPHKYIHTDLVYNYGNRLDFVDPYEDWTDEGILSISPSTYLVHGRHSKEEQFSALHRLINSVAFYAIFAWVLIFFLIQFIWVICCCDPHGKNRKRLMPILLAVQRVFGYCGVKFDTCTNPPTAQPYRRRYRPDDDDSDEEWQQVKRKMKERKLKRKEMKKQRKRAQNEKKKKTDRKGRERYSDGEV